MPIIACSGPICACVHPLPLTAQAPFPGSDCVPPPTHPTSSPGVQCLPHTSPPLSLPAALHALLWLSGYFRKCHFPCSLQDSSCGREDSCYISRLGEEVTGLSALSQHARGVGRACIQGSSSGSCPLPPHWLTLHLALFRSPVVLLTEPLCWTQPHLSKNLVNGCVIFGVSEQE